MATDRVVESNDANGKVLLSASHVYDLTENKSQAEVNSQLKTSLNSVENGFALINQNGDAADQNIPVNYYVYVKNHSTIPEGLYQNVSGFQISSGNSLSIGNGGNLKAASNVSSKPSPPENGKYMGYVTFTGGEFCVVILLGRNIISNYNISASGTVNIVGVSTNAITNYGIWEGCAITVSADNTVSGNAGKLGIVDSLTFTPKTL